MEEKSVKCGERGLNQVTLVGRLGSDVNVRFTPSGVKVGTLSVATNRFWRNAQQEYCEAVDWHRVIVWNCDRLAPYLLKGVRVLIQGRLETRNFEGKDGEQHWLTEVKAVRVMLLARPKGDQLAAAAGPGSAVAEAGGAAVPLADDSEGLGITDDDVPF